VAPSPHRRNRSPPRWATPRSIASYVRWRCKMHQPGWLRARGCHA